VIFTGAFPAIATVPRDRHVRNQGNTFGEWVSGPMRLWKTLASGFSNSPGEKRTLADVTLLGIDCNDIKRLIAVSEISQRRLLFGRVKLLSSHPSGNKNVIAIPAIKSHQDYANFKIKRLHEYVETSHVLIIEHDGFVLNPDAWDDRFLEYDYIGAPWCYNDGYNVGNGGFSLRSRRLLEVLRSDHIRHVYPEDHVIGRTYRRYLERSGMKFAPESLAHRFAIEGNIKYGWSWDGQFGFHSYWATDLSKWNALGHLDPRTDWPFLLTYMKVRLARFLRDTQQPHIAACQRLLRENRLPPED